jgi:hypothetical protein
MPEELYNSHDYCLLVDEYEALKLENEELVADKNHLINAAMDGGDTYHYIAHDIGYRDLERKCKSLESDYAISNRELLIKQVEINRLTAENTALREQVRWIPVSEKEPSDGVRYDVWLANNYQVKATYFNHDSNFMKYANPYWMNDSGVKISNVTHYKSIPQPPEAE